MITKITKNYIALQLPVTECKNLFGKKNGRVKTKLFGEKYEVEADSREELVEQIESFARRAAHGTDLAVVRVNGETEYLLEDAHGVHQYRENDSNAPDGLICLRSTRTVPDGGLMEEVTQTLYDMCQQHWATTGETPDCLPASKVKEFDEWKAWQERYRTARAEGKDDNEAHHIACGLGHLVNT